MVYEELGKGLQNVYNIINEGTAKIRELDDSFVNMKTTNSNIPDNVETLNILKEIL